MATQPAFKEEIREIRALVAGATLKLHEREAILWLLGSPGDESQAASESAPSAVASERLAILTLEAVG
jgi:hypothetical protein